MGPGDDIAVLPDGTGVTVDTLVQGVHFDDRLNASDVGFKAVAVSVSDLASTGVLPSWMLIALSVPNPVDWPWVRSFADGVKAAADKWGIVLQGGDTTRSPSTITVSVTLGGACVDKPMRRDAGQPGQHIWVTGTLGLAAGGYVMAEPPGRCLSALRRPDPPLYFALDLARLRLASASMDISDGLATDLPRLCRASGTGALINPARLKIPPALHTYENPLRLMLAGGDDYELLFTSDPANEAPLRELADERGVALTRIGVLTAGKDVQLQNMAWPTSPFSHFGGPA